MGKQKNIFLFAIVILKKLLKMHSAYAAFVVLAVVLVVNRIVSGPWGR